jgi:hypothetical protein
VRATVHPHPDAVAGARPTSPSTGEAQAGVGNVGLAGGDALVARVCGRGPSLAQLNVRVSAITCGAGGTWVGESGERFGEPVRRDVRVSIRAARPQSTTVAGPVAAEPAMQGVPGTLVSR